MEDVNWPACSITQEFDSNAGWPAGIAADPGSDWLMARPDGLRWALKAIQQRWPTEKIVRYVHSYLKYWLADLFHAKP